MKKLIALVLALAMVFTIGAAFASDPAGEDVNTENNPPASSNGLSHDTTITVTGLSDASAVSYYKVLEWDSTATGDEHGWRFTTQFEDVASSVLDSILENGITAEIARTLAAEAETAETSPEGTLSEGTWTATGVDAGLYMVIPETTKAGVMFNPVFVASNYYRDTSSGNNSYQVVANALDYSDQAMCKKSEITVTKTASGHGNTGLDDSDPYATDVGEVVDFTVETLIPHYPENYTHPVFKVEDTLTGIALTGEPVVKAGTATLTKGEEYTLTDGAEGNKHFLITFSEDYIKGVTGGSQAITVTYSAKVDDTAQKIINQDTNTVDVIYSNAPDDETGYGRVRDKTNHFTFSIDAALVGGEDKTTEAIKIGVDEDGNAIEEVKTYWHEGQHAALNGAVFGLYKDAAATELYTNDVFTTGYVTTADDGRLYIPGLDVGTYYLKEESAPEGYRKSSDIVTVVISATVDTETTVTEEIGPDGHEVEVTYNTNKLTAYSVTVGGSTTTYTIVNSSAKADTVETTTRVNTSADKELINQRGVTLPSTGGIGTTIFYVLGGVLVVGAAIILVARRKAHD